MRSLCIVLAAAAFALLLSGSGHAAAGLENPALLEDREPIRIEGDAEFTAANGVRGGNGTAADPYLIAHWRIQGAAHLVHVANTTKAWVVRNLDLTGTCVQAPPTPAPCLDEAGIVAVRSQSGTVLHNRLDGLERAGVWLAESPGVEVVENLVLGGGNATQSAGILVHSSHDVAVRGNRILDFGNTTGSVASAGIRVWTSNDTLVQGNEVRGAKDFGLNLLSSRRTIIEDNTLTGNKVGLLGQGRDGIAAYNTITDNTAQGVLLNFGGLRLEHNEISFNRRGVDVTSTANATLRENNLAGNLDFGLRLTFSSSAADARENWWGAPNGPNVNGTGPGSGEAIRFENQAKVTQVSFQPFLAERVGQVGAFAPRPQNLVIAGAGPGGSSGPGSDPGDPRPVAIFEGPSGAFVGQEVQLSAARSFDPEGGALRYEWDLGDGVAASGLRARHSYATPGERVVKLTVTDPTGLRGEASIALPVTRPPLAVQLLVNASALRSEELVLRAVVTGQPLGPVSFRFTTAGPGTFVGEGSAANTTRVRLPEVREYLVGVEARAGEEVRTAFERVLVVNRAPVARIAAEPSRGDTQTEFVLSAAGTADADGDDLTYTWDLGGGQVLSGAEVRRRFPTPGLHVLLLTVSDGDAQATAQLALEVAPAAAQEPAKPTPFPALAALAAFGLAARATHRGKRR